MKMDIFLVKNKTLQIFLYFNLINQNFIILHKSISATIYYNNNFILIITFDWNSKRYFVSLMALFIPKLLLQIFKWLETTYLLQPQTLDWAYASPVCYNNATDNNSKRNHTNRIILKRNNIRKFPKTYCSLRIMKINNKTSIKTFINHSDFIYLQHSNWTKPIETTSPVFDFDQYAPVRRK